MNEKGFTLIEVMVALMIVAISLTALTQNIGQFVFQQGALEKRVIASWVAENRLIELQTGQVVSQEKTQTVNFRQDEWQSHVSYEPTLIPSVQKIKVSVNLKGAEETSATIISVLAK